MKSAKLQLTNSIIRKVAEEAAPKITYPEIMTAYGQWFSAFGDREISIDRDLKDLGSSFLESLDMSAPDVESGAEGFSHSEVAEYFEDWLDIVGTAIRDNESLLGKSFKDIVEDLQASGGLSKFPNYFAKINNIRDEFSLPEIEIAFQAWRTTPQAQSEDFDFNTFWNILHKDVGRGIDVNSISGFMIRNMANTVRPMLKTSKSKRMKEGEQFEHMLTQLVEPLNLAKKSGNEDLLRQFSYSEIAEAWSNWAQVQKSSEAVRQKDQMRESTVKEYKDSLLNAIMGNRYVERINKIRPGQLPREVEDLGGQKRPLGRGEMLTKGPTRGVNVGGQFVPIYKENRDGERENYFEHANIQTKEVEKPDKQKLISLRKTYNDTIRKNPDAKIKKPTIEDAGTIRVRELVPSLSIDTLEKHLEELEHNRGQAASKAKDPNMYNEEIINTKAKLVDAKKQNILESQVETKAQFIYDSSQAGPPTLNFPKYLVKKFASPMKSRKLTEIPSIVRKLDPVRFDELEEEAKSSGGEGGGLFGSKALKGDKEPRVEAAEKLLAEVERLVAGINRPQLDALEKAMSENLESEPPTSISEVAKNLGIEVSDETENITEEEMTSLKDLGANDEDIKKIGEDREALRKWRVSRLLVPIYNDKRNKYRNKVIDQLNLKDETLGFKMKDTEEAAKLEELGGKKEPAAMRPELEELIEQIVSLKYPGMLDFSEDVEDLIREDKVFKYARDKKNLQTMRKIEADAMESADPERQQTLEIEINRIDEQIEKLDKKIIEREAAMGLSGMMLDGVSCPQCGSPVAAYESNFKKDGKPIQLKTCIQPRCRYNWDFSAYPIESRLINVGEEFGTPMSVAQQQKADATEYYEKNLGGEVKTQKDALDKEVDEFIPEVTRRLEEALRKRFITELNRPKAQQNVQRKKHEVALQKIIDSVESAEKSEEESYDVRALEEKRDSLQKKIDITENALDNNPPTEQATIKKMLVELNALKKQVDKLNSMIERGRPEADVKGKPVIKGYREWAKENIEKLQRWTEDPNSFWSDNRDLAESLGDEEKAAAYQKGLAGARKRIEFAKENMEKAEKAYNLLYSPDMQQWRNENTAPIPIIKVKNYRAPIDEGNYNFEELKDDSVWSDNDIQKINNVEERIEEEVVDLDTDGILRASKRIHVQLPANAVTAITDVDRKKREIEDSAMEKAREAVESGSAFGDAESLKKDLSSAMKQRNELEAGPERDELDKQIEGLRRRIMDAGTQDVTKDFKQDVQNLLISYLINYFVKKNDPGNDADFPAIMKQRESLEDGPEREELDRQLEEGEPVYRSARIKAYGALVRALALTQLTPEETEVTRAPGSSGQSEQAELGLRNKLESFEKMPRDDQNKELLSFSSKIEELAVKSISAYDDIEEKAINERTEGYAEQAAEKYKKDKDDPKIQVLARNQAENSIEENPPEPPSLEEINKMPLPPELFEAISEMTPDEYKKIRELGRGDVGYKLKSKRFKDYKKKLKEMEKERKGRGGVVIPGVKTRLDETNILYKYLTELMTVSPPFVGQQQRESGVGELQQQLKSLEEKRYHTKNEEAAKQYNAPIARVKKQIEFVEARMKKTWEPIFITKMGQSVGQVTQSLWQNLKSITDRPMMDPADPNKPVHRSLQIFAKAEVIYDAWAKAMVELIQKAQSAKVISDGVAQKLVEWYGSPQTKTSLYENEKMRFLPEEKGPEKALREKKEQTEEMKKSVEEKMEEEDLASQQELGKGEELLPETDEVEPEPDKIAALNAVNKSRLARKLAYVDNSKNYRKWSQIKQRRLEISKLATKLKSKNPS